MGRDEPAVRDGRDATGQSTCTIDEAFRFVLDHKFTGVILTGTKSKDHLGENWRTFQVGQACYACPSDSTDAHFPQSD